MVWDQDNFSAFVKVEVRGGARSVKQKTQLARAKDARIVWSKPLRLEVLHGAKELRIIACRTSPNGQRSETTVVAACGLFIKDVLSYVPIDKYFELFKPHHGGEGGFVRVKLNFTDALAADREATEAELEAAPRKKGGLKGLLKLGMFAGAIAGAVVGLKRLQSNR